MEILHGEVFPVKPGVDQDYDHDNPIVKLMALVEDVQLAAGREQYPSCELQYLFPIRELMLYGPKFPDSNVLDPNDPKQQDNKGDFQKQNVKSFTTADTQVVRGLASAGAWTGPFLWFSYRAGPNSVLAGKSGGWLGPSIRLWVRVGKNAVSAPLTVPYDAETARYAIEIWGWPGSAADLRAALDPRGQAALDRGALVADGALLPGRAEDFTREALDETLTNRPTHEVSPDYPLHPTRPLHLEVAWSTADGSVWDSLGGANYQLEFSMILRGWDNFLYVGTSPNPHGGISLLEYRNLLSNYKPPGGELGREIPPWSFDAFRNKDPTRTRREEFMAVDYMDLHILRPNAAIGLHRHRDNQEAFMVIGNRAGIMVIGDWAKMPNRERCFEVRTLQPGHLALLKGGNLHSLVNPTDEDLFLFMLGGYD